VHALLRRRIRWRGGGGGTHHRPAAVSELSTVPSLAKLNKVSVPLYGQVREASSCQNEVIIPWTHDKIQDSAFPATGKVFEESTKPFGGLAGESRSGDANGQWFRVLLNAGLYSVPAGFDRFFLTTLPLLGANPPPPSPLNNKSPLRPDVPCETQQPPDLRTNPASVGKVHKVTLPNTPAAHARYAKAQTYAVDWLRAQIKREGLGNVIKGVISKPITKAQIPNLRQLGRFAVPKKGSGR